MGGFGQFLVPKQLLPILDENSPFEFDEQLVDDESIHFDTSLQKYLVGMAKTDYFASMCVCLRLSETVSILADLAFSLC